MSLEKRVTALEQEVASLRKLVEQLTAGNARSNDDAPSLPPPIAKAAVLPELAANEMVRGLFEGMTIYCFEGRGEKTI